MSTPHDDQLDRFRRYVDEVMTEDERLAFEQDLDDDESLLDAFLEFQEADTRDVIAPVLEASAPDGFERAVERKIRKRSRGRFFSRRPALFRQRFQIELFAAVAFVLLGTIFLVTSPERIDDILQLDEPVPADTTDEDEENEDTAPAPGEDDPGDDPDTADEGAEGSGELGMNEPEHLGVLASHELARTGRVSSENHADVRRVGFLYRVQTDLSADDLGPRLRTQFGADDVTPLDDGSYRVRFDRAETSMALERLEELGDLDRQRGAVQGDPTDFEVTILPAP